jgi:hypothetical protein
MSKKNNPTKPPSSSPDHVSDTDASSSPDQVADTDTSSSPDQEKDELQPVIDNENPLLYLMLFVVLNPELNLNDLLKRFQNDTNENDGLKNRVRRQFDRAIVNRGIDKKEFLNSLVPFFEFLVRSISI